MKRIFEYPLDVTDYQIVEVKKPAILLSAAEQYGTIVLYTLVDDTSDETGVEIRIIGTGHPIKDDIENYKFLGTVKLADGALMFHVFGRHSNLKSGERAKVVERCIESYITGKMGEKAAVVA